MIQSSKKLLFKGLGFLCLFFTLGGAVRAQTPVTCVLIPMPDVDVCVNDCASISNLSYQTTGDTTCFPGWLWLMPGGNPSTYNYFEPPCVTYSAAGTYQVYLYGVDSLGDTTSINMQSFTVNVQPPPSALFAGSPSSLCINEGYSASIINPSQMPGAIYDWDMGDGNLYPNWTTSVNHNYTTPGTYTVTACVTDLCGTDCQSQIVTVNEPKPRFTWQGTCKIYFFSDTTCLGQIITQVWDFGDNSPLDSSANPAHVYAQNNVQYTVTHTIVTSNGTFTYTAQVIQVGPPRATISGYQTNNCGNGFLTYTIANCTQGIVYDWEVTGGQASDTTGCQVDINWSNAGGYIIIHSWDTLADCIGHDTLRIPACCISSDTSAIRINNTTASNVMVQYAQYMVGTTLTTNSEIIINGVFTIDTTFTFLNCSNVSFGANALTYINPGETLTYDNTRVLGKCDTMWDGNHISNVSATLQIVNGSIIQQAKRAVYSINGGNYFIENSTLRNNYKDIVVEAYTGSHPGKVRGTAFSMAGNFLPAIPALPVGHTKTVCAIEIEDNADITIGDPTLPTYQNKFTNVLVGVRSKNSSTNVYNCRFANFTPNFSQLLNVADAGTGVVAIGQKNFLYQPQITIGGTQFRRCVFVNMRTAIDARETQNVTVVNNNISEIRLYGVRVQRANSRNINIIDNRIANNSVTFGFNTGILLLECYDATANINTNFILQTPNTASNYANQTGTGIRVALVTPGDMFLNIVGNNSINRVKTGIHVQNLIGKNKVSIANNVINFSKPNGAYTTVHAGIKLQNCATVKVRYNDVGKNGLAPVLAMRPNLRGVSMENSTVTVISHNVFTKMGSGVYGWELCGGSSMVCDTFKTCSAGFFFSGGPSTNNACDIGDQVIDQTSGNPAPTGCNWNGCVVDITGKIDSIYWYCSATYVPTTAGLASGSLLPSPPNLPTVSGNQSACNLPQYFAPQAPIIEREQNAGQAVYNAGSYASGSEQGYQGRRNAHRKLKANPTWMVIGTPQDSTYSGFYVATDQSNIGLFRNFEDMAAVDSVQAAGNILSNIADSNYSETNLKVVYSIYQQTWMQGIDEFSPSDSSVLNGIAVQYASDAGEAVYSARVLLGLDVDEFGSNSERDGDPSESTDDPIPAMSLYPNPATDQLTVNTTLVDGQSCTIVITDLQGKVVVSQNVTVSGQMVIDISNLDNGMYFVQMVVDGVLIETNKLEMIHE